MRVTEWLQRVKEAREAELEKGRNINLCVWGVKYNKLNRGSLEVGQRLEQSFRVEFGYRGKRVEPGPAQALGSWIKGRSRWVDTMGGWWCKWGGAESVLPKPLWPSSSLMHTRSGQMAGWLVVTTVLGVCAFMGFRWRSYPSPLVWCVFSSQAQFPWLWFSNTPHCLYSPRPHLSVHRVAHVLSAAI